MLLTASAGELAPPLRGLLLRYYTFTEGGHGHPFSLATEHGSYHAWQREGSLSPLPPLHLLRHDILRPKRGTSPLCVAPCPNRRNNANIVSSFPFLCCADTARNNHAETAPASSLFFVREIFERLPRNVECGTYLRKPITVAVLVDSWEGTGN